MRQYRLRYFGRSEVEQSPYRLSVRLVPNLRRERIGFDAELRDPVRFREAISALHEVVVGQHRVRPRDARALETWRSEQTRRDAELQRALLDPERVRAAEALAAEPAPPDLERRFHEVRCTYREARMRWVREVQARDPTFYRSLVPCDPVLSVADDVIFLEGFAKDESSYACLYVDRDGFVGAQEAMLGTTNVDYSMELYEHLQGLRTYRATRLRIDSSGFDTPAEDRPGYREETIELSSAWLRGFGQLSTASSLATQSVGLDVATVYSLLAHLRRHCETTGARSLVFELRRGKPVSLVLQPWGLRLTARGRIYDGPRDEDIQVWGRRRLLVLARLLPMIERVEVQLLGTGLPSLWIARMGEMRFVLALSGWTANDWVRSAALDLVVDGAAADDATYAAVLELLRTRRSLDVTTLSSELGKPSSELFGALHRLGREGRALYDPVARAYRFRPLVDVAEDRSLVSDEPLELREGKALFLGGRVLVASTETVAGDKRHLVAEVAGVCCEATADPDGVVTRARCSCRYFVRNRLRAGPCRHLVALCLSVRGGDKLRLQNVAAGGGFFH